MDSLFIPGVLAPSEPLDTTFIPISQGMFLCIEGDQSWYPLASSTWTFSGLVAFGEPHYLGQYSGSACFAITCAEHQEVPGYQWVPLRQLWSGLDDTHFELASRASQIHTWARDHQYCGRCGKPTQRHSVDRAMRCHHCEIDFYPRLSPCVITLITRDDFCLLGSNSQFPNGMYSALAGFIEPGETVESCLRREVQEEVGITVSKLTYFASQPWPFPGQLMLGFFAEYDSGDIVVDGVEITHADWFHVSSLPKVPPANSLAGRLIKQFIDKTLS